MTGIMVLQGREVSGADLGLIRDLLGPRTDLMLTRRGPRERPLIRPIVKMRYDNNSSNLLRRSDQWPFLQNGVPALWFHTGLHPDYHTQYDRPEKINYEKMERIARRCHAGAQGANQKLALIAKKLSPRAPGAENMSPIEMRRLNASSSVRFCCQTK